MKTKKEIQDMRDQIRTLSGNIVDLGNSIDRLMVDVPHKGGMVSRNLNPKSPEYISHTNHCINIVYEHTDGVLYEIIFKKVK